MIKGLDNGYLYTKDNELNIFPSAFSTEDKVVSNAILITIDNKQYYTGIGNWIKDILSEFLKGDSNTDNTISKNVKIAP